MKDKEKQIKEMAKDCCKSYERCKPCNCLDCVKRSVFAKAISKGYRKLPEDSVVLTREEFEKNYVSRKDYTSIEVELKEHMLKRI